jgi:hypothetical protein
VNIVLNGLPKTWHAFAASMNTRKEYLTFEELWTCCAQEESGISTKEKPQKKCDDQDFTAKIQEFQEYEEVWPKEGNRRSINCRRKGTLKEGQA